MTIDELEPAWLRVIGDWCSTPGRTGPTIPYVFGAVRVPVGAPVRDERTAQEEFDALLDAIDSYPLVGRFLSVRQCHVIGQLIIALEDDLTITSGPWATKGQAEAIGNLQISIAGLTQEEARAELWPRSREAILAGHYSFVNGAFRRFDPAETHEIGAILGR